MAQITSREELEKWLKGKPADWAQVIASRAALRMLPYAFRKHVSDKRVAALALSLVRALTISWAARSFPAYDMEHAAYDAGSAAHFVFAVDAGTLGNIATHAIYAASRAAVAGGDAATALFAATDASSSAAIGAEQIASNAVMWANLSHDCDWLESRSDPNSASRALTRKKLWPVCEPVGWNKAWHFAADRLCAVDESYGVWMGWYARRIRGERASFAILGDKRRKEDKAILARLADATNEDFWDKGAEYVNTTLQSWIDEARERAAPKTVPPQVPGATAYGVDYDDKVDRLPATDQKHLRDSRDQQQIYKDVREAAEELQREGQRLGERLEKALRRLLHSMPENFADAECYSVWRDGNALRRIHLAHRAVADGKDPDDKRLDPAMAQMLGGVLDLYNQFAFGDDGLRKKDEDAVPPQERAKAKDEAVKAAPLIEAVLKTPEIITDTVRDDLIADKDDQALPEGDPYDDQALSQSNKVKRNIFAALLSGAAKQIKQSGKSVREGAEREVGAMIVRAPLIGAFVAAHFQAIKTYAETAYASVSLQWLWDAISKLGDKF